MIDKWVYILHYSSKINWRKNQIKLWEFIFFFTFGNSGMEINTHILLLPFWKDTKMLFLTASSISNANWHDYLI